MNYKKQGNIYDTSIWYHVLTLPLANNAGKHDSPLANLLLLEVNSHCSFIGAIGSVVTELMRVRSIQRSCFGKVRGSVCSRVTDHSQSIGRHNSNGCQDSKIIPCLSLHDEGMEGWDSVLSGY